MASARAAARRRDARPVCARGSRPRPERDQSRLRGERGAGRRGARDLLGSRRTRARGPRALGGLAGGGEPARLRQPRPRGGGPPPRLLRRAGARRDPRPLPDARHRRVPGHRLHAARHRLRHRARGGAPAAVPRRRPEAEHLPLPRRGHLGVERGRRRLRRGGRGPRSAAQLPQRSSDRRFRQRRRPRLDGRYGRRARRRAAPEPDRLRGPRGRHRRPRTAGSGVDRGGGEEGGGAPRIRGRPHRVPDPRLGGPRRSPRSRHRRTSSARVPRHRAPLPCPQRTRALRDGAEAVRHPLLRVRRRAPRGTPGDPRRPQRAAADRQRAGRHPRLRLPPVALRRAPGRDHRPHPHAPAGRPAPPPGEAVAAGGGVARGARPSATGGDRTAGAGGGPRGARRPAAARAATRARRSHRGTARAHRIPPACTAHGGGGGGPRESPESHPLRGIPSCARPLRFLRSVGPVDDPGHRTPAGAALLEGG